MLMKNTWSQICLTVIRKTRYLPTYLGNARPPSICQQILLSLTQRCTFYWYCRRPKTLLHICGVTRTEIFVGFRVRRDCLTREEKQHMAWFHHAHEDIRSNGVRILRRVISSPFLRPSNFVYSKTSLTINNCISRISYSVYPRNHLHTIK